MAKAGEYHSSDRQNDRDVEDAQSVGNVTDLITAEDDECEYDTAQSVGHVTDLLTLDEYVYDYDPGENY